LPVDLGFDNKAILGRPIIAPAGPRHARRSRPPNGLRQSQSAVDAFST